MELSHDWVGLEKILYRRRRTQPFEGINPTSPLLMVVQGDTIVEVFAEGEDFADWIGGSRAQLSSQNSHREILCFEQAQVDQLIRDSLLKPHFHDQIEFLRTQAKPLANLAGTALAKSNSGKAARKHAGAPVAVKKHFLIEGISSWWSKLLPSHYGVFIQVDGRPPQQFLFLVRRGCFEGFLKPDLSYLGPIGRFEPKDAIKYLSEKYLVPVQGLYVPAAEWDEWSQSTDSWRLISEAFREGRAKMVPKRRVLTGLIALRAYLGL